MNCEEETFPFAVVQSSLLCEDQKSSLKLEPLSSVLPPKTRSGERRRLKNDKVTEKQDLDERKQQLVVIQAVAGGELCPLLHRPEEIQGSFEDKEEARASGPHSQGQLSRHGHFTSTEDARRRL